MIRKLLGIIHGSLLRFYDKLTAQECEVSVGDIILRRAEFDHCQFLLTTRKLDVSSYLSGRDRSFPYQNTISRAVYGAAHKEEQGNRMFATLIESYMANGYVKSSLLTVDKECRLIDGNHRMGLNLHMGIERINVRYLRRFSPFPRNLDTYLMMGISSFFMEEVYTEFCNIQKWLIKTGNTFCCTLKGEFEKGEISLLNDLRQSSNVLNVQNVGGLEYRGGVLVQFAIDYPSYYVKGGRLYSRRAEDIERLLHQRKKLYGLDVDIKLSKNCIEGKEMWKTLNINRIREI